jgi:nucleotide-binding universal stress UspA family protein
MPAIKHLLLATDGSSGALKAAAFAGDLARALSAEVTILIVHNQIQLMPYGWGAGEWPLVAPEPTIAFDEMRLDREKYALEHELNDSVGALGESPAEPHIVQIWGHAAEEICRYALDHDVNLIIIGSRGRSDFARLLLGSISSQVASHATCPVTIVH